MWKHRHDDSGHANGFIYPQNGWPSAADAEPAKGDGASDVSADDVSDWDEGASECPSATEFENGSLAAKPRDTGTKVRIETKK